MDRRFTQPRKTQHIPSLEEQTARAQANVLKVLADPTRLRILSLLQSRGGRITVQEMVECFALAQPTISFHLSRLRAAKLVDYQKERLYVYYFVREEALVEAYMALRDLVPDVRKTA